jgi:hypothetical protein
MRKLAVSALDAEPARSTTVVVSATFPVAAFSRSPFPSRPRTFDSNHEDGGGMSPWDKRAC